MNITETKFTPNCVSQRGVYSFLNQTVFVLAGGLIFFNPFPHTTAIKEISFYLVIAIVIFLIASKKSGFSLQSPLTVPFALFVLWAGASTLWAVDVPNTIHDVYAHLIKCIAMYYVLINYYNSEKRLTILTWLIIISTAIFAIKGMANYYIIMDISLKERLIHSTGAPVNSSAILNLFCTFLSLFFLTREKRWLVRIFLVICFAGTFTATLLSYSRAALIALFISAVVLFLSNKEHKKRILPLLVILSLVAGGVYLYSPHLKLLRPEALCKDPRIGIYYTCLEIFKDHPLAGVGFGGETFEKHMWNEYNSRIPEQLQSTDAASSPHGFVFDIMVRLGLVGLVLFGVIIIRVLQLNRVVLNCQDPSIREWGPYLLASLRGCWLRVFLVLSFMVQLLGIFIYCLP